MVRSTGRLKAVDFFCGAGGMSFGLAQAGIDVIGGIDNSVDCRATYLANLPQSKFIRHDVARLSAPELGRRLGIVPDDPTLLFCGCSPCQFWSKIRTDKTKSARTAFLLKHFQKFIRYFRPGFIAIENVPGLARKKDHSILNDFTDFISKEGYNYKDGVINAAHYRVPQNRMRYLLIASRVSTVTDLPEPTTDGDLKVRDYLGEANGFSPIGPGHRDRTAFNHSTMSLSEKNVQRIALTPQSGGDRSAWADRPDLQINAYRENDKIFRDVYGRMSWDKPAPTITTKFLSLSNGRFGHPDENRAISVREGATLQTFPKTFVFHAKAIASLACQIGNAVPPELARCIGEHIVGVHNG